LAALVATTFLFCVSHYLLCKLDFPFSSLLFNPMRSLVPLRLFLPVFTFTAITYALKVPIDVLSPNSKGLERRAPIPVVDTGNAQYSANITIGGVQVRVLLDTGRSVVVQHFHQNSHISCFILAPIYGSTFQARHLAQQTLGNH
jgi:hypothetical protein